METRAPFVVVGAFVLAAIVAVFGFVYWLQNTGGLGPRTTYHVQFEGSVPGLLVGAAVLFNGIRVGEVTDLGLAPGQPARRQCDDLGGLDDAGARRHQGRPGVPGPDRRSRDRAGRRHACWRNSGAVPTLIAEPGAGQGMTQAARDALRKVDSVLSGEFRRAEGHHRQFQGVFGRPGAQHRQARRHRRRPRTHDRRHRAAAEDHL